jgi:hypothetical protein
MIQASYENLVSAFRAHKEVSIQNETISHKLIKVYAAECAVKASYLDMNSLKNTQRITKKLKDHGHEFHFWLKAIKAPKSLFDEPSARNEFKVSDLHQRLRYGIPIPVEVEVAQMKFIQGIIDKIGKLI